MAALAVAQTWRRVLVAAAVILALAACGHMPITSMYKLRNFDPATTDLNRLRVAVQLSEVFRLRPNGVRLTVTALDSSGRELRKETFKLNPALSAHERHLLRAYAKEATNIYAFRLSARDVGRFNDIRALIAVGRPNGTRGAMGVATDACRTTGRLPERVLVTTLIKSSETQEFVPLLVDFDLLSEFKGKDFNNAVPLCSGK